ncbi:MAG: hypothetical protein ACYDEA_08485 [Candidatus Dormibacteria bacterium]
MDRRRWRARRPELPLPELSKVATSMGGWLRQRAEGPGLEAVVAGGMLGLIRHSARVLKEVAAELERAVEPPPPPARGGRRAASAGKGSPRPPRVRKAKPDDGG